MNILPHKSWHVRTKKNIERVRRDEEKAAEEEKERLRRVALAEQEARTDLLRKRAGQQKLTGEGSEINSSDQSSQHRDIFSKGEIDVSGGHLNFFKDLEDGEKNAEHEAEKKAEKEEFEKKLGILTYLGQSEREGSRPWYVKPSKRKREEDDDDIAAIMKKRRKNQDLYDPLEDMKKYLHEKKKKHKHKHSKHSKHKHNSREKDNRKPYKSQASVSEVKSSASTSGSKTIEQLRAERLKREREERQRTDELLAKLKGDKETDTKDTEISERNRGYNSVFNPEFVRQPRKKREELETSKFDHWKI